MPSDVRPAEMEDGAVASKAADLVSTAVAASASATVSEEGTLTVTEGTTAAADVDGATDGDDDGTPKRCLSRVMSSDALLVRELTLAPVLMVPQQLSRATEIQLFLERIELLEVRSVIERDEGVVYYVVDLYRYQQQKGIPTRRKSAPPTPRSATPAGQDRRPDYQIEQRYSSFARLRHNVANIARKRHPRGRACAYCDSLLDFLQTTPSKPSLKVKFTTTVEDRQLILGAFINDLVYAVRDGYGSCARSLHGYHIIPALVRRFLAEQTGANFFRY